MTDKSKAHLLMRHLVQMAGQIPSPLAKLPPKFQCGLYLGVRLDIDRHTTKLICRSDMRDVMNMAVVHNTYNTACYVPYRQVAF